MNRQASVQSISALRQFRVALREYAEAIEDAASMLSVESQQTVDWVQVDRAAYWPREVKSASDELAEALSALEMKQLTIDGRDPPAATEERQRVQVAKRRQRQCEEKVRAVRQASGQVQHLADEYRGVLGKLAQLVESDLPQAMATLERMEASLEKYAAPGSPTPSTPSSSSDQ